MRSLRFLAFSSVVLAAVAPAGAAEPKAIAAAIDNGVAFLDGQYKNLKPGGGGKGDEGIGPVALAGLALMENGKAPTDATVKAIAAAVREAAFAETRTYQLSLCLLYLDRLGEPADGPTIQMLAVRLLAGQNGNGGWTYDCIDSVPKAEEQRLRARIGTNQLVAGERGPGVDPPPVPPAAKGGAMPPAAGRLHPEVEKHRQGLLANAHNRFTLPDDNSNTQFAILAVWVARRHGVPVEPALDLIEKRFLATQSNSGGWPYSGLGNWEGSPSMTCAGLLGLATAVGRREERRLKAEVAKKPEPKPAPKEPKPAPSPDDPFFTPPPKPVEPKKAPIPAKRGGDVKDKVIELGLENLSAVLRGEGDRKGKNAVRFGRGGLGDRDLYFLWSLERVGVVYGLEKIGGVNWYQFGADILLREQARDGSWGGAEVDTAFALLFLARSNFVRDLSAKVQRDPLTSELRGGPSPLPDPVANAVPTPNGVPMPLPRPKVEALPTPIAPAPVADDSTKLAAALVKVPAGAWTHSLEQVRDGKGGDFTKALVLAIHKLDGDRKKEVREALAERLTRMSAETLRVMLKGDDAELRRAAALACAMKDDKAHVPDLIDRLGDDEEIVVRAARAGLKSLSGGRDFGPTAGATKDDRALAADAWRAWWAKQK